MPFDDVFLLSDKLQIPGEAELTDLSTKLLMPLPLGYADFMRKLGTGLYCDLVRVYPPDRILRDYAEVQRRWDQYFFWDKGADVLTKDQVLQCVIFADSIDGDEIIAHPDFPGRLFVLPRQDISIYSIPSGFNAPLSWHSTKKQEQHEPTFRFFEAFNSRAHKEFFTAKELFSITDLAPYFCDFWMQMGHNAIQKPREKHEDEDEGFAILFVQGIGGRIQLVQSLPGDKRMRVRIDYDADHESDIAPFVSFLTDMGFYQTGTSEKA